MDSSPELSFNNKDFMLKLVRAKMHFGKYKGTLIIDLPEAYLVWFRQKGFPPGMLGQQMSTVYEIRVNGLEDLIRPLRGL